MDLKAKARVLTPVMALGKNGITQGAITQLLLDLETKSLVKVKLLKGALEHFDRKEAAEKLAAFTKSEIVQQVGNVIVLYKKPAPKPVAPPEPQPVVRRTARRRPEPTGRRGNTRQLIETRERPTRGRCGAATKKPTRKRRS